MKSIKSKLIVSIAALMLVSLTILATASYWNAKKVITKEIETSLTNLSRSTADAIGIWLDGNKNNMEFLASSPYVASWDLANALPYMRKENQRFKEYLRLLMIDKNGEATYSTGNKTNLAERGYFKQVMATGKSVVSDPVMSKSDKKLVVVAAAPITNNGELVGAFAGTIALDAVIKRISEIKAAETGYAFVINKDGLTLFHPNEKMAMQLNLLQDPGIEQSLKDVAARMVKGEQGLARYAFKGEDKFLAFAPIPGTTWSLGINVPVNEVTAQLDAMRLTAITITGVVLVIAILLAIASGITRPLNAMKLMLQDIAQGEGDLTKRLDESSNDELGDVARSFNLFVKKLHGIIEQVSRTTLQVAASAEQLSTTSNQMASGAEKATDQVNAVATAGEEMSATSGNIARNCCMAAESSQLARDAAASGSQVVVETIGVIDSVATRVKDTANIVEDLGKRSVQISAIVGTIQDIADQTNLLALNAAIEAARAGEQGRGFAVVADEVRALSERTGKATREISDMIQAIQNDTKIAVTAIEDGVNEVTKGSEKASDSGKALENILEQINNVSMQINEVATAAEEQTAVTAEISSNMHQISGVISETSSGAQESAAAAYRLAEHAEELRKIVGQFKLS